VSDLIALLFDVDGTLADTEEIHRHAFNVAFAGAGLDWVWSRSLYSKLLGVTGGKERIRHFIETYKPTFSRPVDLDAYIADLHAVKTREYIRFLAEEKIPLRPGVKRLLRESMAEGLRLGIATTTSPENIAALLEHSIEPGASAWFDVIAAGNVVPNKKPAPDIFQYALEELGLAATECLAIEDSQNGLQSASQAGLPTFVTVNQYTDKQDFKGALLVVDHLGEPDQPFTVLAGKANGATYADVALLRKLHGQQSA
jgi:HAD superfamily hydrolase (TIGR01509 family)